MVICSQMEVTKIWRAYRSPAPSAEAHPRHRADDTPPLKPEWPRGCAPGRSSCTTGDKCGLESDELGRHTIARFASLPVKSDNWRYRTCFWWRAEADLRLHPPSSRHRTPGRAEVGAYQDLGVPHYRCAPYQPVSSHTWPPLASLGPIAGERGSLAEASNRERFEQESIASHMMAVGQRRPYPSHRFLAYHAPAVRVRSPYGDQAGA